MAFAFRELKLVVEPGGAVALAALLVRQDRREGQDRGRGALRRQRRSGVVLPAGGLTGVHVRQPCVQLNSAMRSSSDSAMSSASGSSFVDGDGRARGAGAPAGCETAGGRGKSTTG